MSHHVYKIIDPDDPLFFNEMQLANQSAQGILKLSQPIMGMLERAEHQGHIRHPEQKRLHAAFISLQQKLDKVGELK